MPTYEYQCQRCGHRFERFQQMSDPPVETCPRCGGRVRRLLGTGSAVITRGGDGTGAAGRTATRCGRSTPCCGRAVPCDVRPCDG